MKRIILAVIAAFFPWLSLLLLDDPVGALIALILQASIIGWLPATLWVWHNLYTDKHAKQKHHPSKE